MTSITSSSSMLNVRQKSIEKLRIQESDILESIQSIRNRIYRSDIETNNKYHIDRTIKILEDSIRDYFALEVFNARAKKIIGNN